MTVTGAGVSTWADQSGTGDSNKDAVQGTDADRPPYSASDAGYNNKPLLTFDGTSDTIATGTWAVAPPQNDFSLFIVGNADNAGTDIFISDHAAWEWTFFQAAANVASWFGSAQINATPFDMSVKHAFCVERDGGNDGSIFVDSNTAAVTGTPNNVAVARVSIGSQGGARFLNGKIAEIILYTPRLAAPDRLTVLQYLGARYGITIS